MHFMYAISPLQCQIARKHLGWHQVDLAKAANLSLSTVSSFENGFSPRRSSVIQMRKAFETSGMEFTEGDGVKRRDTHVLIYRGVDRYDQLLNDMTQTIHEQRGDILCITQSQEMMLQILGFRNHLDFSRLGLAEETGHFKCLMSELPTAPFCAPMIEFRTTLPHVIGPMSCFIYGNKYVQILPEGREQFFFVLYHIPHAAISHRLHFQYMWDNALPLRALNISQEPSVRVSRAI